MRYDDIGEVYNRSRRPEPFIAEMLNAALGTAKSVVNVGAGAGSYEPSERSVTAVEPSAAMIARRPAGSAQVVQASAENLPFEPDSFDAAMAVLTIHHWHDWRRGVAEMLRVAPRGVILTWDPEHEGFWLTRDYFPALIEADRRCFPSIREIRSALPNDDVVTVPIPAHCSDGFLGAYWSRPQYYLDPNRREAISTFSRISDVRTGLLRLAEDLESGAWHLRNSDLRGKESLDLGYRLIKYES